MYPAAFIVTGIYWAISQDRQTNHLFKISHPLLYLHQRIPRELWEDRLQKVWAAGVNAIEMYIFWNEHEPLPGVYDFDGQNDIFAFIELAQKIGFVVIFRAGLLFFIRILAEFGIDQYRLLFYTNLIIKDLTLVLSTNTEGCLGGC